MKVFHIILRRLFFLTSCQTPNRVWKTLLPSALREWKARSAGNGLVEDFARTLRSYSFSTLWFLPHIPVWSSIFRSRALDSKKILEIGSWEGLSLRFLATLFPSSQITAVDTWQGSEENKEVPLDLERRFHDNTADLGSRLNAFKGRSSDYFRRHGDARFDLIYIDGSHDSRDVLLDGLAGWDLLNPGGFMVFDDYMWFYYREKFRNPCWAINVFLRLVGDELVILHAGYQLFVQKNPNL